MGKVIAWQTRAPDRALDALNRCTGLDFDRWPESLLPVPQPQTGKPDTCGSHRQAAQQTDSVMQPVADCSSGITGMLMADKKKAL